MNFSNHFSFEQYQQLHDLYLVKESDEQYAAPCKEFYNHLPNFYNAIVSYLKERNQNVGLNKIQYGEGHSTYFQECWNKLINKEHDDQDKYIEETNKKLAHPFMTALLSSFREFKRKVEESTPITLEEKYEELVDKVNKGTWDFSELSSHSEKCDHCGSDLSMSFEQWKPSFVQFNHKKRSFDKPENCIELNIIEKIIEFKTGELLIADWFRIKEFTEQVEYNKDYKEVSINYAKGRINSTINSIDNGFITVHVGNTCPTILQDNNSLIFGRVNNEDFENDCSDENTLDDNKETIIEKKGYIDKGYVCTDLWNVTIIEKEQLINIVAKIKGKEDAIKTVEAYLEKNDYNSINIEPGVYKLRFDPDYENFYKKENDSSIPNDVQPMFTLKKENLQKQHKIKM